MNSFSKVALFSVAMLISGSVFAQPKVVAKSLFSNLRNAISENVGAGWKKTKSGASAVKAAVKSGAKTVWTPSFVKSSKEIAVNPAASEMVQASILKYNASVDKPVRRFAYRAALVSAVVAPIAFVVYKKYGKKIAAQFNAAKEYVESKFATRKFEEVD